MNKTGRSGDRGLAAEWQGWHLMNRTALYAHNLTSLKGMALP